MSTNHNGLSIIIKISVPLGITFWVILSGPAKLIAEDKKCFKWIVQERERVSTSFNCEADFSHEGCGLLY